MCRHYTLILYVISAHFICRQYTLQEQVRQYITVLYVFSIHRCYMSSIYISIKCRQYAPLLCEVFSIHYRQLCFLCIHRRYLSAVYTTVIHPILQALLLCRVSNKPCIARYTSGLKFKCTPVSKSCTVQIVFLSVYTVAVSVQTNIIFIHYTTLTLIYTKVTKHQLVYTPRYVMLILTSITFQSPYTNVIELCVDILHVGSLHITSLLRHYTPLVNSVSYTLML